MLVPKVITSISSVVLKTGITNSLCKKDLTTNDHVHRFNLINYLVCIILFATGVFGQNLSLFTIILGAVYGIATAVSAQCSMRALSIGPMHITLLITTSSMIIPTMSGVFFGEEFSLVKLIFVIVLIGFIYLSLGKTKEKSINTKWLIFVFISFICTGLVGVLQKIHQTSEFKNELSGFLLISFILSFIYSLVSSKKGYRTLNFKPKHWIFAVICGVCIYLNNVINLELSGILPAQVFFPLINGTTIVLNSLVSVFVFKEKINTTQAIGLIGGILTLIAIAVC